MQKSTHQGSSSKRTREEAFPRLTSDEQEWKNYHFFVGQILSYISSDNCYNEVEIVEIDDDAGGVGQISKIKVRYFGWHQDYDRHFDEWIDLKDDENCKRFGKYETGVHRVKCFVNLPGLPYWPCMGLIREPASDDGMVELRRYNQMYVEVSIVVVVVCSMAIPSTHFLIRSLSFILLCKPFGNPKEDKELSKIFKIPSKLRIRQGVHVRYLVNKNRQVLPYYDGILTHCSIYLHAWFHICALTISPICMHCFSPSHRKVSPSRKPN